MAGSKNSRNSPRFSALAASPAAAVTFCALVCAAVMFGALWHFYQSGVTLWYGDAEAHLNIARRIVDSRTPGWSQIGSTWLPLPHLIMLPFVRHDELWRTGLAGAIPAAISMALAATFLFAAIRRIFSSTLAATAATAAFLLNPNTLYLGAIPMTEPFFFASLFALLYFTVRFTDTKGWGAVIGAGIAACAATLTRYEGWFLIPFAALFLLVAGKGTFRRIASTLIFCIVASIGPALWMAHNRYYFGDPLYFYRGPWSAAAIQGNAWYPGRGDWHLAANYYLEAGKLLAGTPALLVAALGAIAVLARKQVWPLLLFALPPAFYIWSIHSSSTPIFVPTLWPHSFYNTRYAMAFLPLVALGVAAIARYGKIAAALALLTVFSTVLLHPSEHSITWRESDVNSRARRQWIAQAALWLKPQIGPNETFLTSFNDMTGIYRTLGIPLRNTLTGDNDVEFAMAMRNPQVFLHVDWAIVTGGDEVQGVLDRARRTGPRYDLRQRITVKEEPALEIYKRVYDPPELP